MISKIIANLKINGRDKDLVLIAFEETQRRWS